MSAPERICVCGRPESDHTNVAALRGEVNHFFQRRQIDSGTISSQAERAPERAGAQRKNLTDTFDARSHDGQEYMKYAVLDAKHSETTRQERQR